MKWIKETLIIYDKKGKVIKERDVTGLPYPKQQLKINACMTHSLEADHWDIVRVRKTNK